MARAKRLQGEIAIITGSDSGIGQATAIAMASEGADVVVTYLHDREGAEETRKQVEKHGQQALVIPLDQRRYESVVELFNQTMQTFGIPTILVNNAATMATIKPLKDLTPDEWDDGIKTDLYGPFYCCKQFLLAIEDSEKHGTIINITSVHQEIPMAGAAIYDAAKGGLRNLTTTLALEVSDKNINVNNIAPGMVLTPMNQESLDDPELQAEEVSKIPMKRAATPEEIANVAVFLASRDARYIQGSTITVDGALTLKMALA